ncbi:MTP-1 family protein [Fictibacillus barbaricus]|uniref:DUF1861 family protein n=1 Tax=Fictibacillus barbaricus TaxID=182136 RepID=A0ABU1U1A0_9BACL|nr:DUF1861 family protein [Fictibacillus barbaricus]MDR7073237.1 hypothetical protein [Fictibacillus barbaricus]
MTKTCAVLVEEFLEKSQPVNPTKLKFTGVGERDVYNITAPFEDDGEPVIAGRVESRDSEHSKVYFFVNRDSVWTPREGAPILELQDPFVTRIAGELVLGGVEIFPHPTNADALSWRTSFYKGASISELKPFFKGPDGMKDLRVAELKDGSVAVLTRPQGEKGGRGKIGFARIPSLKEFSVEVVEEAPLLEGQFGEGEWGGANELHILENGMIGVLGHIASFDEEENRHYYPMVFLLNPETGEHSEIQLIAIRDDFLEGASKRPDLVDVVFSGGLVRKDDGTADFYAGISDAEAHRITISDPFNQFEK